MCPFSFISMGTQSSGVHSSRHLPSLWLCSAHMSTALVTPFFKGLTCICVRRLLLSALPSNASRVLRIMRYARYLAAHSPVHASPTMKCDLQNHHVWTAHRHAWHQSLSLVSLRRSPRPPPFNGSSFDRARTPMACERTASIRSTCEPHRSMSHVTVSKVVRAYVYRICTHNALINAKSGDRMAASCTSEDPPLVCTNRGDLFSMG